ncbi:hypothetical protein F5882DRAFT_446320 [Hyaloscypha sp. PMI_1271]|nr:hypothetical protein F5882DRAFT_446320 [Hyaloscypha sp. PMI_1271]
MAVYISCLFCVLSHGSAQKGDVKIDLRTKERAIAFWKKCPSARIDDREPSSVFLKASADLVCIRPSESEKYVLVFRLLHRKAARDWCKKTVVGKRGADHHEVRLKLKWEEDELDHNLGLKIPTFPRQASFPPASSESTPSLKLRSVPLFSRFRVGRSNSSIREPSAPQRANRFQPSPPRPEHPPTPPPKDSPPRGPSPCGGFSSKISGPPPCSAPVLGLPHLLPRSVKAAPSPLRDSKCLSNTGRAGRSEVAFDDHWLSLKRLKKAKKRQRKR